MLTSIRSWAAALFLAMAIWLGWASPALAHRVPACDISQGQAPVQNPHCQPGHPDGDTDGDGDVDEDDPDVDVAGGGVRRADTGFGGSAGTGSETTVLLVGGGLAVLGAAFGVRRVRRAKG